MTADCDLCPNSVSKQKKEEKKHLKFNLREGLFSVTFCSNVPFGHKSKNVVCDWCTHKNFFSKFLSSDIQEENLEGTNKRKHESRPSIHFDCDSCEIVKPDANALHIHKTTEHTATVSISKKQKQAIDVTVTSPSLYLE